MAKVIKHNITYNSAPSTATLLPYNNTDSGLSATTTKGAIDELADEKADKTDVPEDLEDLDNVSISSATTGQVLKYNSTSGKWENANESGGGSGGHTIVDEDGTSLTQRTNLQFNGAYLEDNSTDDTTEVNVVRSMTRAEFDLLSSDEKVGIINITDEAGNGTYHEYSTSEQIVGKWVDGSTIYEKTVYNAGGVSGNFHFAHNISNIGKIISYSGTVNDTAYSQYGDLWALPRIAGDNNFLGIDYVTATDIYIVNASAFNTRLVDWYITIRYTKSSS